jgi:hypothetical protein
MVVKTATIKPTGNSYYNGFGQLAQWKVGLYLEELSRQ